MVEASLAALRFAQYAALMSLIGGAAFPFVALRGGRAAIASPWTRRVLLFVSISAIGIAIAAMTASIAAMMGLPPWRVAPDTVIAIVTGTDTGWAFVIRIAALSAIPAALRMVRPPSLGSAMAAFLSAIALATLAWSGHAAASMGVPGAIHRLNDAVHLIAAALWIGAIAGFLMLIVAAHRTVRATAAPLLHQLRRFAPIGIALVGVVAITGLINAQVIVGIAAMPTMLLTRYGLWLALKLGLVGVMLLCAARNARISRRAAPISAGSESVDHDMLSALRLSLMIEIGAAIGVLVTVAILGLLSPVP